MTPLAQAQQFVLENCSTKAPVQLRIDLSLGCVISRNIVASQQVPPFDNTAMDGFALRSCDASELGARLRIIGNLAAGALPNFEVGQGQAVRIMTGAAMPAGADCVVPIEQCSVEDSSGGDFVVLNSVPKPGDCIRRSGGDVELGQVVFKAGEVISAGHIGVLASIGLSHVEVFPRICVGVLSTGDELIEPPAELCVGQIRDSNRHTLIALCKLANCDVIDIGIARDSETEITQAIQGALERCDVLLTSGGVSVGDFDYVKVVLNKLSAESQTPMQWMQVAVRPAKPFAFGVVGDKPCFGLPGNPVSSIVGFELFARPALRQMMGHTPINRRVVKAVAMHDFNRHSDGKVHFVRVDLKLDTDGVFCVGQVGEQGSHLLRALALSNALAILPDGAGAKQGEHVEVMVLDNWA